MPLLFKPRYTGRKKDPISNREYQSYSLDQLDELGINYKVMPLAYGDYLIIIKTDDELIVYVIERKTVSDLVNSFIGGGPNGEIRIDVQMEKCLKNAGKAYDDATVQVVLLI